MRILILFIFLIPWVNPVQAQINTQDSLLYWQQQVHLLQQEIAGREARADSLNRVGASRQKVSGFAAQTFALTRQLQLAKQRAVRLEKLQAGFQAELYQHLRLQIDSLLLQPAGATRDQQLLELMSRQLEVSPAANRLQFNPVQLQAIDTANPDSLARTIYSDYLQRSAGELEKEISLIAEKENQFRELATLENKARVFMEEIEGSQMLTPPQQNTGDKSLGLDYSENAGPSRNLANANQQAGTFFRLFNQPGNLSTEQPLSYEQLVTKLEATRTQLEAYRQQVLDKIDQLNKRP